jgi:hypothetical protein
MHLLCCKFNMNHQAICKLSKYNINLTELIVEISNHLTSPISQKC